MLTFLFVVAACMTIAYISWVIGYGMMLRGYKPAKPFYPLKKDFETYDRTTHLR